MDWTFASVNGGLCALAIAFAVASPKHGRREAVLIASLQFANWVQYVLAWTDYRPAALVAPYFDSKDIWAFCDGLVGVVVIGVAWRHWWGWAIWATTVLFEVIHGGLRLGWYEFAGYSRWLDLVFLAQIAVFLLLGGGKVGDILHRGISRLRLYGRQARSSASRKGGA